MHDVLRALRNDYGSARAYVRERGLAKQVKRIERPRVAASVAFALGCWGVILAVAFWTATRGIGYAVLGLPIIAIHQRQLRNLLHDASHFNMVGNNVWNDRLADLLMGIPCFEPVRLYRADHQAHHAYLGIAGMDPDLIDTRTLALRPLRIYLRRLFDRRCLTSSVLAYLPRMTFAGRLRCIVFWSSFLLGLYAIGGVRVALVFAASWIISRTTLLHAINVFTELSDHAGRPTGTVLRSTRTMPPTLLARLFYPYHERHHLAHHLFPRVPTYRLKTLHRLLAGMPAYRASMAFDGVSFGHAPLAASWMLAPDKSDKQVVKETDSVPDNT
ncbi:MAG TPA: fatty acid desaturase [Kofleriaceae bacterium]|nr:fatty acid desaturase [Kofleriaceae bacterium]